jgi:hypothetical protein
MQIFVKHPQGGRTFMFDCSKDTTLAQFVEWFQDRSMWPQDKYYILFHGRILPKYRQEDLEKTFGELNIRQEDTFHLMGRFRG